MPPKILFTKYITGLLFCFLFPVTVSAQDTLLLLNGDILSGRYTADIGDYYHFSITKKRKIQSLAIDKLDVFSVRIQGQDEKILYKPDSVAGNDFSVEQMRAFWQGEHEARLHYRPVLPVLGGVLAGAVSPALGFWGLTIAPVYLGGLSLKKPEVPKHNPELQAASANEFYAMGYGYTSRRIKVQRSAMAALGGIVTVWIIKVAANGLK